MAGSFEVIVVGGGMLGLSTAYHLGRMGAPTLLLQAGDIGAGSSAACSGRAQVAEGKLDPFNLALIREGFARLGTLEDELGIPFSFRRAGFLALIDSPRHWDAWSVRSSALTAAGIPTEMLDRAALQAAEPHLNTVGFLGAAYAQEGLLNPFLFCWAYTRAAQRAGAVIKPHAPVTRMHLDGGRVIAVEAGGARYTANTVAVMCGAWTGPVLALAGAALPIHHTHAEAFVTDPTPLRLHNTIQLANFYDLIHGKAQAVAVGFHQEPHGKLVVTEAVHQTPERHTATSAWGITGVARDLLQLYPDLAGVRLLRAWGAPTPFTPDEAPLIGWVPGRVNLFTAVGLLQTITSVPVVSAWMAQMILGEPFPEALQACAPDRFQPLEISHDID